MVAAKRVLAPAIFAQFAYCVTENPMAENAVRYAVSRTGSTLLSV